jgi:hypothetical protein
MLKVKIFTSGDVVRATYKLGPSRRPVSQFYCAMSPFHN